MSGWLYAAAAVLILGAVIVAGWWLLSGAADRAADPDAWMDLDSADKRHRGTHRWGREL